VRLRGRIDMLAVDEHDAYWLLRHSMLTGDGPATDQLAADEAAITAAWAWEQFYPGLEISGTIHNELRLEAGVGDAPGAGVPGAGVPGASVPGAEVPACG